MNVDYLHECFNYCHDTGNLYWKVRPLHHFKEARTQKTFNTRFSGKEAGNAHSKGYLEIRICDTKTLIHRVIGFMFLGMSDDEQIDHINGIKTDNRLSNLRVVTNRINHKNMPMQKNNVSGITGVYYRESDKIFIAQIKLEKVTYLGCFKNIFDAACARKSAENRYGFHENHGRRGG